MTIDWATLGYNILTVFLLLLVISGAMPVITTRPARWGRGGWGDFVLGQGRAGPAQGILTQHAVGQGHVDVRPRRAGRQGPAIHRRQHKTQDINGGVAHFADANGQRGLRAQHNRVSFGVKVPGPLRALHQHLAIPVPAVEITSIY